MLHDHRARGDAARPCSTLPASPARAKRIIKQTPFLWKATVALRTRLAKLRGHGKPAAPATTAPAAEQE